MNHVTIVDGRPLPARLSGNPALDFVNTRAGWNGGAEKEYLATYDDLAVWAEFVKLTEPGSTRRLRTDAAARPAAARTALRRAHDARDLIYCALTAPHDEAATQPFSDAVQAVAGRVRLVLRNGEPAWEVDPSAGLATPMVAALWSAAQLLTSSELRRVTACPGHGCGWLFVDRSGRRRWCTMETCGNRAKARRFAERRRAPGAGS